jgi:uridine phosphorylase
VLLNLAGGIGPDVTAGEVAIVEAAVRDDGISDHYLPPGDTVDADVDLTGAVERALAAAGLAARRRTSWTTPAIYRQTLAQLDHYTRAGVSIVESEVASLFAVTRALGAAAAAVVVTTGVNVSGEQTMAADLAAIGRTQREAFRAILDALTPKA